jgi:hypothetical protein
VNHVTETRLLARTFFSRMFESDLMPEGLPQVQLILWGTLLAATPTTGYPLLIRHPVFDSDRIILITLTMVAIGFVALVIWDGVYPDRRDVRILGPLPIANQQFVLARLLALAQVFVLFAAPVCVPQAIMIALIAAGYGGPIGRIHGTLAHFITVVPAAIFVFSSLIAVQCLLLLVFGRRAAQGASMVFQVLFAVGLIQMLVFLGEMGRVLGAAGAGQGLGAALFLPPTWFLGLHGILTGDASATAQALARLAVGGTIASVLLAVGLYACTYGHLSRRALEAPAVRARRPRHVSIASSLFSRGRGFHSPLRQSIRQFAIRTVLRSRTHRMMLAVYAGIALALVLSSAASVAMRDGGAGLWRPGIAMLSMPLILQFLLLVGLRVITAVPSEPKGRWAFRAGEPADRHEAVSATRDMMIVTVVIPTTILALVQGVTFWGVWVGVSHAAFDLVIGTLFSELLIARTAKLPFACTYFPGKSKVFALWPLYLMVFFFYTVFLSVIESALLTRPGKFIIFCLSAILLTRLLALYRRHSLVVLPALLFEEEDPDAIFGGFNLSEGLAAAPRMRIPEIPHP